MEFAVVNFVFVFVLGIFLVILHFVVVATRPFDCWRCEKCDFLKVAIAVAFDWQ